MKFQSVLAQLGDGSGGRNLGELKEIKMGEHDPSPWRGEEYPIC